MRVRRDWLLGETDRAGEGDRTVFRHERSLGSSCRMRSVKREREVSA